VFSNGAADVNLTYDEVGDINITLHEITGSEFAAIDSNDTDFNATVDDSPQTVNDDYREINASNVASVTVIPDHFNLSASLQNHQNKNFTYLSADLNMSATLDLNISAKNIHNVTTENYVKTCAAKPVDINVTFGYDTNNISLSNQLDSTTPLLSLLYEKSSNAYSYGLHTSTNIGAISYNAVSKNVFITTDQNGTAQLSIKLNLHRLQNQTVDPFEMNTTGITVIDTDGTENNSSTTVLPPSSATYLYARAKSTLDFYDDVTTNSISTPITIQVYCSLWPDSLCQNHSINLNNGKTNNNKWWLSTAHDTSTNDGNITLKIDVPTSGASVTPHVSITANGIDTNVNVAASTTTRPLKVQVDLDTTNPGDTSSWLIYNPASALLPPSPFYKVKFIGSSGWAGSGQTGNVVESNANKRKIRRLEW
jgi:hypothetical protein